MKKLLLLLLVSTSNLFYSQVIIYDTTHASNQGVETTPTANGSACQMGDAIVLSGTARYITSVSVDMFNLNDVSPFSVTMTIYTDCPTVTGSGTCGSGTGTLIPNSSVTVNVPTPPTTAGTLFQVVFPFNYLDLNAETDNTITVMINASRANVFWRLGETPSVGAMPAGETGMGFVTRCGSSGTNNGCARNFGLTNNFAMTISASQTLSSDDFILSNFTIYPNPANDLLSISSGNKVAFNHISLVDINGRLVKSHTFNAVTEASINVSDLNAGIYFMKIKTAEGVLDKKIIKE